MVRCVLYGSSATRILSRGYKKDDKKQPPADWSAVVLFATLSTV